MQQIWDENQAEWGGQVAFVIVNGTGLEDGLDNLNNDYPQVVLPVMQDDSENRAYWNCGASGKYFYVLDGDRNLRFAHYFLHIDDPNGDGQRALDEIEALLGSR